MLTLVYFFIYIFPPGGIAFTSSYTTSSLVSFLIYIMIHMQKLWDSIFVNEKFRLSCTIERKRETLDDMMKEVEVFK